MRTLLGFQPFAFIGGSIPVSKEVFYMLLGFSLLVAGTRLLFFNKKNDFNALRKINLPLALFFGATLGLLSGMVGIGGGIFLAPILLNLRWGRPKEVAATASLFILVNSVSGLAGQIIKSQSFTNISNYILLFAVVFLGGQIGSRMGSGQYLSQRQIAKATAMLVLFVGIRLVLK